MQQYDHYPQQDEHYMQNPAPPAGKLDWLAVMTLVMGFLGLVPIELLALLLAGFDRFPILNALIFPALLIGTTASLLALRFAHLAELRWRDNLLSPSARRLYKLGALLGIVSALINALIIIGLVGFYTVW